MVLRLGPILPILLVGGAALVRWRSHLGREVAVAAVASAAAGVVHLALIGEHFGESVTAGIAFAVVGLWQVALGMLLAIDQRRRGTWIVAAQATAVVVIAVYVASRTTRVPSLDGREAFDALGIITTLLAVVAALAPLTRHLARYRVPSTVTLPLLFVAVAAAGPLVFGVSGVFGRGALTITTSVAALVLIGATREQRWWAAADGAIIALIVRAPNLGALVVAGLIAGVVRAGGGRGIVRLPAAATATAAVLAVPALNARLDLLHVGHPADTAAEVVVFVAAGALASIALAQGRVTAVVAAYATYATIEAARFTIGTTGLGAIEVPITSLSVLLLVTVAALDASLLPSARASIAAGGATGLAIGVLRALNVAYPTPWGVVVGVSAVATERSWTMWRRPSRPDRTGRASAATLPGTESSRSGR
ncbi:MAG: hypothetical protein ABJD24_01645 [Acidimicrobiales bacterium]